MTDNFLEFDRWKETVRAIFDDLHFGRDSVFEGSTDLARRIVAMIEERHHDYFCEGRTLDEWNKAQTQAEPSFMTIDQIKVGMRLRRTVGSPWANQAIVTGLRDNGFVFRIPDDEEIVHPHWSLKMARDGHEAFAIDGKLFWEPVP